MRMRVTPSVCTPGELHQANSCELGELCLLTEPGGDRMQEHDPELVPPRLFPVARRPLPSGIVPARLLPVAAHAHVAPPSVLLFVVEQVA
jgi:hypothetical protein